MNIDRTAERILIFFAILVILMTGFIVDYIATRNSVSSGVDTTLSTTGSRLSDDIYLKMSLSEQQGNDDRYIGKYAITIYNDSNYDIYNWSAIVEVPEGTRIIGRSDIETTLDGKMLIISPVYYNLEIRHGEELSFGMTLDTPVKIYPTAIRLRGFSTAVLEFGIFRRISYFLFIVWIVSFVGFFISRFNFKNYRKKEKNDIRIILQSMNTFISFIDAKDPYTRGHSRRVAMYAAEIAKRMHLSEDEVQNIYYAGLLHDAGKISVPDAVLNKPGRLTDEERKQIQEHTVAGGKMLKQLSSLRGIRETALYHHERFDGTGYPEGLKGESIPLYARIVGVADSYDAMSSNRVYRRHLNKDEIIEEIQQGAGTQFDPNIVVYMVDMINDGYVNVVKMETAENEDGRADFHLTEDDIPGVYMGV